MKQNILLIDDDRDFIEILKLRLSSILPDAGYTVFHTLASAENYLKEEEPVIDLVVIDEHLPDGRGSEFIKRGYFLDTAVLSMSSDPNPEVAASSVGSGATFFLNKTHAQAELFKHLVLGLLQRNILSKSLQKAAHKLTTLDTVKKMISTLKHEINNPLAAIIGGLYLLNNSENLSTDERQALKLIETSSTRIKEVIDKLQFADELTKSKKANQEVFNIPGDAPWGKKK